jgi:16S rRNA (guanine527-N7)-methyltransferase
MDSETIQILERGLAEWYWRLTSLQKAQFEKYATLLTQWNTERMNLTRLISPSEIATLHFLDSIALFQVTNVPKASQVLDIGTGAGFPGLVLKIARPGIKLTLIEATAKKLSFCKEVVKELNLKDVETFHGRAEEIANRLLQKGYNIAAHQVVVARAVAPLATLLPWAMPYVAPDGIFVAWKGPRADDEMREADGIARALRVDMELIELPLPETGSPPVIHAYVVCRHKTGRYRTLP